MQFIDKWRRLWALWNGATGDCLLDSVAQAVWGVSVSLSPALPTMRGALADRFEEQVLEGVARLLLEEDS